jgi:hypothetical protein
MLKKLSPTYLGPYRVIKALTGDFYEVQDHVQDKTLYTHARDMRLFEGINSDQQALELGRSDTNEHFVEKIIGHVGDPTKLRNFRFLIKFDDDGTVTHLPLKEVEFVPMVHQCVKDNPELSILLKHFKSSNSNPGKRTTPINTSKVT